MKIPSLTTTLPGIGPCPSANAQPHKATNPSLSQYSRMVRRFVWAREQLTELDQPMTLERCQEDLERTPALPGARELSIVWLSTSRDPRAKLLLDAWTPPENLRAFYEACLVIGPNAR